MTGAARIALASAAVGISVLALKLGAWWMTGAVAILSDAIESSVNIAAALIAFAAIRLADRPADTQHPYGHHKAELLSAVLEGILIVVAALFILRAVWFAEPATLSPETTLPGLLLIGLATLLNAGWARYLIGQGKALRAPALTADGQHLWADVVTSIGVALGVMIAVFTGVWWLDPLIAAAVALYVLWSGSKLVRASLSGLLDEALPQDTLELVKKTIAREGANALEAHDLRSRISGRAVFIEFHLIVSGDMSVKAAHDICDKIEEALSVVVPGSQTVIHLEPDNKAEEEGDVIRPNAA